MTNPDIISDTTNNALREASSKYFARIAIEKFTKGVSGFAEAYLATTPPDDMQMLVTTYIAPESLAISLDDGNGGSIAFLNIDLDVPGTNTASIVEPGLYDEHGNLDTKNGQMLRKVARPLTELEGRELTMDLYSLMNKYSENE